MISKLNINSITKYYILNVTYNNILGTQWDILRISPLL